MQFQPGQSGNPAGKKPGTLSKRTQLARLFEPHAPALIAKCIEMALAGNESALRLAIERIAPRAKDTPVLFHLPQEKITPDVIASIGEDVLRLLEQGEVTPNQAKSLFEVIKGYRDNIALEEVLEDFKRLSAEVKQMKSKIIGENFSFPIPIPKPAGN